MAQISYNYNLEKVVFSAVSAPEGRSPPAQSAVQTGTAEAQQKAQLTSSHSVVSDPFNLSDTISLQESNFRAGSLKEKFHIWQKLTRDPEILKILKRGHLTFEEPPFQDRLPHEIQFSGNFKNLVATEIEKFLEQGIIEP